MRILNDSYSGHPGLLLDQGQFSEGMTISERGNSKEALIVFVLRGRVAFLRAVLKQKLLDLMKSLGPCILAFDY